MALAYGEVHELPSGGLRTICFSCERERACHHARLRSVGTVLLCRSCMSKARHAGELLGGDAVEGEGAMPTIAELSKVGAHGAAMPFGSSGPTGENKEGGMGTATKVNGKAATALVELAQEQAARKGKAITPAPKPGQKAKDAARAREAANVETITATATAPEQPGEQPQAEKKPGNKVGYRYNGEVVYDDGNVVVREKKVRAPRAPKERKPRANERPRTEPLTEEMLDGERAYRAFLKDRKAGKVEGKPGEAMAPADYANFLAYRAWLASGYSTTPRAAKGDKAPALTKARILAAILEADPGSTVGQLVTALGLRQMDGEEVERAAGIVPAEGN